MYSLALCYDFGRGVERDPEDAIPWYTKAAELGDDDAQHNLAIFYEEGEGVPADAALAGRLLRSLRLGAKPCHRTRKGRHR